MLTVGVLVRSGSRGLRLLRLPAPGVRWPVRLTCAAAPPSVCPLPVRWSSGVGGGVRAEPGADGTNDGGSAAVGPGTFGWYDSLADTAAVRMCEELVVGVQHSSGAPWWLSIVMVTLSVRTLLTLPLAAYQLVVLSKVEALQVEISQLAQALRHQVSLRAQERGWTQKHSRLQFQKNLRRIVSELYIRENCHPFKASLLVWVQVPVWVCFSVAIRNLSTGRSAMPCDLTAGGALWFSDLSSPDSTWILPLSLGFINLLIVEIFSVQRTNPSRFQKILLNFIRGFSVLMVPVAAMVPSSMCLYWFASSLIGFSHNLLLRSGSAHKLLKLPTPGSNTPIRDLMSALINKYRR